MLVNEREKKSKASWIIRRALFTQTNKILPLLLFTMFNLIGLNVVVRRVYKHILQIHPFELLKKETAYVGC